jgi:hypothetical protein
MNGSSTFLLIADIAGYTRFMNLHRVSLAHAQDIVARLLEAVIDAAQPVLKLAKIEGDAAFFYARATERGADGAALADRSTAIYRAFHEKAADLRANTLCPCDGCQQAGMLKLKLVGHVGDVAVQKVKQMTELAGVDVILVHRLLKNDVPVPEYLLMTRPLFDLMQASLRERAAAWPLHIEELGPTEAYYVDLTRELGEPAPPVKLSLFKRLARHMRLSSRSIPYLIGTKQPCAGFRNIADAA